MFVKESCCFDNYCVMYNAYQIDNPIKQKKLK